MASKIINITWLGVVHLCGLAAFSGRLFVIGMGAATLAGILLDIPAYPHFIDDWRFKAASVLIVLVYALFAMVEYVVGEVIKSEKKT